MALDEKFFISAPLDQYFVDKDTGLPLCNGTLTFYRDTARTTPKLVYQLTGTAPDYTYTALTNPIVLSSVGTLQDAGNDNIALYFYPYEGTPDQDSSVLDLYYIVCKNEDGVEQWTREGWPNLNADNDPTKDAFPVQNQLANPQFSRVFLNGPDGTETTYTVNAATTRFNLAPDWDIEVYSAAAGSVTVKRTAIAGSSSVITSPPYVLDVNVASGTTVKLIQRLKVNSGAWASTSDQSIYLASTLVGQNEGSGTASVNMYYKESTGGVPLQILSAGLETGSYQFKSGISTIAGSTSPVPTSTNTDTGTDGYVEIYVEIPGNTHVSISSLQVVPTLNSKGGDLIQYDTKSSNREQALMGDYFIPNLEAKQAASLLTGWDFPLNPAQFGEAQTLGATSAYIWDQTIGERTAGAVTVSRNATSGGINFSNAVAGEAFYIMQYLTGAQAKKILSNKLSVNAVAYKGTVGSDVTMRVYMYRSIASYTSCVAASTANLNATYANGASGVGATLTNAGALAAFSLDGVSPSLNQRVLIKNQTSTFQNGIYTVTTVGSGAVAWVLTRATDYDTAAEMLRGAIFPVDFGGTTNGNTTWSQNNTVATVGTDPLAFTASASVPLIGTSIGSVAAGGVFTLNTTPGQGLNWTEITRGGLGTATATLPTVTTAVDLNTDLDIKFTGWQVTDVDEISDTDKFAIVVTFNVPTDLTQVTVDSISVTPGNIPTRPATKSKDQVLDECRYYYQKSYKSDVALGTITENGQMSKTMIQRYDSDAVNNKIIIPSITLPYTSKRHPPTLTFYRPDTGASGAMLAVTNGSGTYSNNTAVAISSYFLLTGLSQDRAFLRSINTAGFFTLGSGAGQNFDCELLYHFLADSRLGVV